MIEDASKNRKKAQASRIPPRPAGGGELTSGEHSPQRQLSISVNGVEPSQTECQTEASCLQYLDIRRQTLNVKPSQTEHQTEPIAFHIWTFHVAALTSIIILFKTKDAPNQSAPASSNYTLEF